MKTDSPMCYAKEQSLSSQTIQNTRYRNTWSGDVIQALSCDSDDFIVHEEEHEMAIAPVVDEDVFYGHVSDDRAGLTISKDAVGSAIIIQDVGRGGTSEACTAINVSGGGKNSTTTSSLVDSLAQDQDDGTIPYI